MAFFGEGDRVGKYGADFRITQYDPETGMCGTVWELESARLRMELAELECEEGEEDIEEGI